MFGIDEGSDTTSLLAFGNGMDGQCRLTRRLRTLDLNDASFGVAANT